MLCALAASHGDLDATAQSPTPAQPPWVSVGADGRLKYRADAQGNRIPDFSMVGYGTGIVPLPDLPVKMTLEPAAGDQTARIQAAFATAYAGLAMETGCAFASAYGVIPEKDFLKGGLLPDESGHLALARALLPDVAKAAGIKEAGKK